MADLDKIIDGVERLQFFNQRAGRELWADKPKDVQDKDIDSADAVFKDVLKLLKEQEKEIKALRLLVEWAEECDFGFDQFPDEYERYKEEIEDMDYIEGMIHVAKRTLEDNGVFKDGEQ